MASGFLAVPAGVAAAAAGRADGDGDGGGARLHEGGRSYPACPPTVARTATASPPASGRAALRGCVAMTAATVGGGKAGVSAGVTPAAGETWATAGSAGMGRGGGGGDGTLGGWVYPFPARPPFFPTLMGVTAAAAGAHAAARCDGAAAAATATAGCAAVADDRAAAAAAAVDVLTLVGGVMAVGRAAGTAAAPAVVGRPSRGRSERGCGGGGC